MLPTWAEPDDRPVPCHRLLKPKAEAKVVTESPCMSFISLLLEKHPGKKTQENNEFTSNYWENNGVPFFLLLEFFLRSAKMSKSITV